VSTIIDGLLAAGHRVGLLGAPSSPPRPGLTVVDAAEPSDIRRHLMTHAYDVVHDHTNGAVFSRRWLSKTPSLSTYHLTGRPADPCNAVYLSASQRELAHAPDAPVVRLPVNPGRVKFRVNKSDHLLFLGRVSPWKGALEAAAFADAAGRKLWLAGPAWEEEYLGRITVEFGESVELLGDVGGAERTELLASAAAILVLSQPVVGPWGGTWQEPGATVVAEAAASGTPVIGTENGCLPEIVPHVGTLIRPRHVPEPSETRRILSHLPSAAAVRAAAIREWDVSHIVQQYIDLYCRVTGGDQWGSRDDR
jgi:glycosyltransferase involved in cell wall biosynthesis